MFENVIVGVDGQPHGQDAIALARHLAAPGSRLTVVNVRSERDSERSADLARGEAQAAGLDATVVSVFARSARAGLHLQAADQCADLLVVGACSRGALERAVFGNDAGSVIVGSPCAVAVAADGFARHEELIRTIGVAYDGSPASANALATARELAEGTGAKLRALRVVLTDASPGYVAGTEPDSDIPAETEGPDELAALPNIDVRVAYGLPAAELAAFGDTVDILVAGTRGYGPVRRLVTGSTCSFLERHMHRSLLVVPTSEALVGDIAGSDQHRPVVNRPDLRFGIALDAGIDAD